MIRIEQVDSKESVEAARGLFREYESWLAMDLCFQGFEDELMGLPGKYAPPDGRLYLAYIENELAGIVALRRLEKGICEMKRLFLRENARGHGLGKMLVERLIIEAKAIGYTKMRLDTFPPKMGKAVKIYESYGFRPIEKYYDNPHEGVLFMELDL